MKEWRSVCFVGSTLLGVCFSVLVLGVLVIRLVDAGLIWDGPPGIQLNSQDARRPFRTRQ